MSKITVAGLLEEYNTLKAEIAQMEKLIVQYKKEMRGINQLMVIMTDSDEAVAETGNVLPMRRRKKTVGTIPCTVPGCEHPPFKNQGGLSTHMTRTHGRPPKTARAQQKRAAK